MKIIKTKLLTESQFNQINQLWNDEYPEKLKDRFAVLLEGAENYHHYLIEDESGNVIAWAVIFEKDKEVRFSIIVREKQKGKSLGTALVKKLKEENKEFYGWVIDHNNDNKMNGEKYQSPIQFYVKQGFEILHDKRIDSEMLKAIKIKWKE